MYRFTKAIGFTAISAAVLAVSPASGALAGTSAISVSSLGSGIWLSNTAMPVSYAVGNLKAYGKCSPLAVTLWWKSSGDETHHRTVHPNYLSLQVGTFTIPAGTIWPGTLRYRITAKQSCSGGNNTQGAMVGHAPAVGWSETTVK